MRIEKEIIINASIDKAWKVLGVEFADAYKWSSVIKHSEAKNNESVNGSSCSERGCDISGMGNIKERLLSFSAEDYSLSYQIFEGLPSMMKYAENNWKLISMGDAKTKLEMVLKAETQGFMGTIMKPMMKMNFSNMGKGLTEDFKHYVETGKPSPNKVKALAKVKK